MKFVYASTLLTDQEFQTLTTAYGENKLLDIFEKRFEQALEELVRDTKTQVTLGNLPGNNSEESA